MSLRNLFGSRGSRKGKNEEVGTGNCDRENVEFQVVVGPGTYKTSVTRQSPETWVTQERDF